MRIINNKSIELKEKLFICLVLCLIVLLSFIFVNKRIDKNKFREYKIANDIKLINSIESINIENDNIIISGYAYLLNISSRNSSISLFLNNIDNEEDIWIDIEQVERLDVNSYFNSEYDYSYSGFIGNINKNKLNQDDLYEIVINIDYYANDDLNSKKVRKTVSSKQYIFNNRLYNYNPYEFDKPDLNIDSDVLKNVFLNGELCFYKKESGMYVYQYEGKLFWIATKEFEFENNKSVYIPFQVFTSQADKLPKNRVQYMSLNLDFDFMSYELIDEMTEPYRVAIRDIPEDFPITYIKTGVYDKKNREWIWTKSFHIKNIFHNE